jgi:hypothetical protein
MHRLLVNNTAEGLANAPLEGGLRTALHVAVERGNEAAVALLLAQCVAQRARGAAASATADAPPRARPQQRGPHRAGRGRQEPRGAGAGAERDGDPHAVDRRKGGVGAHARGAGAHAAPAARGVGAPRQVLFLRVRAVRPGGCAAQAG